MQQTASIHPSRKPSFNQSIRTFVSDELSGWKRWEISWFAFSCAVVFCLSIYWGETPLGIISATTGIAYTLCNGKGKRMAYLFGIVNCALYAYISFGAGYYGEVMLNAGYYLPMMFVGFFAWNRRMDTQTHEVQKRCMSIKGRIGLIAICIAGSFLYGLVLHALGDPLPYTDAFTTFCSIVAMIVAVGRYMEQWVMWTAINSVTVVMWAFAFVNGGESIATLAMWVVYLATGIIMYVKWAREIRNDTADADCQTC